MRGLYRGSTPRLSACPRSKDIEYARQMCDVERGGWVSRRELQSRAGGWGEWMANAWGSVRPGGIT